MYRAFYNLKEQPFNLTPSPPFLYLGKVHKEALAVLTYGVVERKGFVLLTGDVGTGKSTMVQALLSRLDENVQCVHLPNPVFSRQDFLSYLAFRTFKKRLRVESKTAFLIEFEAFLKEGMQHQKNFILVVDEAQKLSFEVLEEIRLLSNMGTADKKLVNIFLVGQSELNYKLSLPEYRPLLQRVSMRYHVWPLDLRGTQEYIAMALDAAGARNGQRIFPKDVIKAIHEYAKGYPRMINILADNLLLLGYARGQKNLTPSMVKECHDDMKLEGTVATGIPQTTKPQPRERSRSGQTRPHWKWALAILCATAFVAFAMSQQGKYVLQRMATFIAPSDQPRANSISGEGASVTKLVRKLQQDDQEQQ